MSTTAGAEKRQPPSSPVGSLILIFLFTGLGGAFLYWSVSQLWYLHSSRNWASTQGVIYESRYIDHGRRKDGEARIRYRYAVDGRTYEGGNLLPGTLAYTDRDEKEKVRQYRPGMTVPVYYNPENPEASSLEVGVVTRFPFLALALGLPFILYAAYTGWCLARGGSPRL